MQILEVEPDENGELDPCDVCWGKGINEPGAVEMDIGNFLNTLCWDCLEDLVKLIKEVQEK